MGFLDSTHMYTHTHYLHIRMFLCVHVSMATVASYAPSTLSYNATVVVTVFYPTGPGLHTKDRRQNYERSRIKKPNTVASY